jgi:hypothetical protein
VCSTHNYVPELQRENRARQVNRRGRLNGRQRCSASYASSTLNKFTFAPSQIPPVSAAKHNGAGSDLVLNCCVAYLGSVAIGNCSADSPAPRFLPRNRRF